MAYRSDWAVHSFFANSPSCDRPFIPFNDKYHPIMIAMLLIYFRLLHTTRSSVKYLFSSISRLRVFLSSILLSDVDGEMPSLLHVACRYGLKSLALDILDCPKVNLQDLISTFYNGRSATKLAQDYGHTAIAEILKNQLVRYCSPLWQSRLFCNLGNLNSNNSQNWILWWTHTELGNKLLPVSVSLFTDHFSYSRES